MYKDQTIADPSYTQLLTDNEPEQWVDGTLECYNDPRACIAGWCCGPVLLASLYDRVVTKGVFLHIVLVFALLSVPTALVYRQAYDSVPEPEEDVYTHNAAGALYSLLFFGYVYYLRRHFRREHNIAETYCVGCEDVCCAFWLPSCTICQISRHADSHIVDHQIGATDSSFTFDDETPVATCV